jgi:arginase
MPLAIAVGHDAEGLGASLRLTPVAEERVVLAGARDLDPLEAELLDRSSVRRETLEELPRHIESLPAGPIYLHVDVDVLDPGETAELRYPARSGASVTQLAEAIQSVLATGAVCAIGLACSWSERGLLSSQARELPHRLGLPIAFP